MEQGVELGADLAPEPVSEMISLRRILTPINPSNPRNRRNQCSRFQGSP
jgi:hypothetical protein